MSLKNNKALKYFALLLFTFELLSPVLLYSTSRGLEVGAREVNFHSSSHSVNLLTLLICEEAGNEEEREGKDHKLITTVWESAQLHFSYLPEKFELEVEQFNLTDYESSRPSLVVLLQNYRI